MSPIKEVIINKKTNLNPVWIMRQAGRYLPEFREIRKANTDFIKLCLNPELSSEITLQPLKRFDLDAAIIFSDILMLPYGLNQKVEFKKNYGPILGQINLNEISKLDQIDFVKKVFPVYKAINKVSNNKLTQNKSTIGFVGAPWTLLVYMINRKSPKLKLDDTFFDDNFLINRLLIIIDKYLKIHIKNQVDNGAEIIQIFDSWAGLLNEKDLPNYVYVPTLSLIEYTRSLNVPVICFPKGINTNYKEFNNLVKPDGINLDYDVDPIWAKKNLSNVVFQGGINPNLLLSDERKIENIAEKYLDIFKDVPYIFNLGHGLLPETDPDRVNKLVKFYREY